MVVGMMMRRLWGLWGFWVRICQLNKMGLEDCRIGGQRLGVQAQGRLGLRLGFREGEMWK